MSLKFADLVPLCEGVIRNLTTSLNRCDPAAEKVSKELTGLVEACTKYSANEATTLEAVLDAICSVEDAVKEALTVLSQCSKHGRELTELAKKLSEAGADLQAEVSKFQFLAEFRDYASGFRTLLVRKLQEEFELPQGWNDVAFYLITEEEQPAAQQPVTTALKSHLTSMGFSWQEWQALRELSDAGIKVMHTGTQLTLATAMACVDGKKFPTGLEHVRQRRLWRSAVKKALHELSTAKPPALKRK